MAILRGRVLAVTPKVYLPNYREFYEQRHFASGAFISGEDIVVAGQIAPFGSDTLLEATDFPGLVIHTEICEDVWVPIPPSARAALAGATVLLNLSASNAIVGKSDYRETLCARIRRAAFRPISIRRRGRANRRRTSRGTEKR